MPQPNTQFELSVNDLDLIEAALREKKAGVSMASGGECEQTRSLHDLLGRLHNQKEFFRPKTGVFVGG